MSIFYPFELNKKKDTNGWWYGYLKSDAEMNSGFVASNYVSPIVGQVARGNNKKTVKALFDYQADGEGEMTIKTGDELRIVKGDEDRAGWTLVENIGTMEKGWVPTEYLG